MPRNVSNKSHVWLFFSGLRDPGISVASLGLTWPGLPGPGPAHSNTSPSQRPGAREGGEPSEADNREREVIRDC